MKEATTGNPSEKEPWAVLIGATALSLAVVLLFGGCSLPDFSLPVDSDALNLGVGAGPSAGGATDESLLPEETTLSIDQEAEQEAALRYLNAVRARLGVAPMVLDQAVSHSAQNHADYLWHNEIPQGDVAMHEESAELPGFTGTHYWDRLEAAGVDLVESPGLGEVIASHPRSVSAVVHWLETAYHRLPLISPDGAAVGYGHVAAEGRAANVMNLVARGLARPAWPALILYPSPGQADVPASWDGLESPRPPAPATGFPSGPVVSLSTHLGAELRIAKHTIRPEAGAPLPHVFLTAQSDPHLESAASVLLYADEPLAPATRYVVQLTGEVDGVPFDETWHFTTAARRGDCTPGAGQCGPGRACYHVVAPLTCEFEGIRLEDVSCEHVNDCAPGLTCFRGSCQAYCGLAAEGGLPVPDCSSRCSNGHVALPTPGDELGVCLPRACDPHGDDCGEGHWCSWGGGFLCDIAGTLPAGEACDTGPNCQRGATCLDFGEGFRCHALCVPKGEGGESTLASCGDVCPNAQLLDAERGVAVCP